MGWADLLRLLEGTVAEGGRPWPTPEAPEGRMVTTIPCTLSQNTLTVLPQMTSSFRPQVGAGAAEALRRRALEEGPGVQDPGLPQLLDGRMVEELKEPELKLGQGRGQRPLVGKQQGAIFLELQRRR